MQQQQQQAGNDLVRPVSQLPPSFTRFISSPPLCLPSLFPAGLFALCNQTPGINKKL